MNCRIEGAVCTNHKESEIQRSLPPRILIEGPQGSGKTSLTKHLGGLFECGVSRGFPSSDFIKHSESQVEICEKSFALISEPRTSTSVYDRSPISQFVWEARNGVDFESCILCATYALNIMSRDGHVTLLFIDAEPTTCIERQDITTDLSIDAKTVVDEVILYREFFRRMKELNISNVDVVSVFNSAEFSKEDFLSHSESVLLPIIRKNHDN